MKRNGNRVCNFSSLWFRLESLTGMIFLWNGKSSRGRFIFWFVEYLHFKSINFSIENWRNLTDFIPNWASSSVYNSTVWLGDESFIAFSHRRFVGFSWKTSSQDERSNNVKSSINSLQELSSPSRLLEFHRNLDLYYLRWKKTTIPPTCMNSFSRSPCKDQQHQLFFLLS